MKHVAIIVVLVGITGYVAACAKPAWFEKTGLDVWNLGSLRDAHKAADLKYEELQVETERIQQRVAMCEHVASSLIAGHMSLEEASAEVERICQTDTVWLEALHCIYREDSHRAVAARYLVHKVETMMLAAKAKNELSQAQQLSVRLDELSADLRLMLSQGATGFATNQQSVHSLRANTGLVDAVAPSPLTHP
jgi:hypothetical protein